MLFAWLLWGDFCFTIFESIFGKFLPLYMKDLKASNTLIGIMTGSIAGVVNVLFLPPISMASDRFRSRWGRRIPFLFWSTPCTVAALALIGFAPEIGAWLQAHVIPSVSVTTVVLASLCAFVVLYHFSNMVLVNLFNCLLRDVVPQEVMARFLSLFRVVGTVGTLVFFRYVFPYVLEHRQLVCAGVGGLYLAAFLAMCWRVKEGQYPPPPQETKPGLVKVFVVYFRECLSLPIYRNFFIMYGLGTLASTCATPFVVLFARDTLGLSMADIGKIFGWQAVASGVLFIPVGVLCDKFSSLRVMLATLVGFVIASAYCVFFVHDRTTWFVYAVFAAMIPGVGWNLGMSAVTMLLFPSEKFGQLSSGISVFGFGCIMLGNYLAGWFMDVVHSDYRMIFAWSLAWFGAAIVPMLFVYRGWKQHGGPHAYVPPLPPS